MPSEKNNQSSGVSRRNFLKGVGMAGAAGLAASVTSTVGMPKTAEANSKNIDYRPRKKYEIDKPYYEKDMVGALKKCDERDVPFARHQVFQGFPERLDYYKDKPDLYKFYKSIVDETPQLLGVGEPADNLMAASISFSTLYHLTPEYTVDGEPSPNKIELTPERAAEKIKGLTKHLGADMVGIGPLNQAFVYTNVGLTYHPDMVPEYGKEINLTHKSAIAIAVAMDNDMLKTGPVTAELVETTKCYGQIGLIAVQIANYIRALGYPARAHHLMNYQVACVPVAVDAGLGEVSRNGMLITQEYGTSVRLAVVTTDLPLVYDKPVDIGAQAFCEDCKICADYCPSGAVPTGEKAENRGLKKWTVDQEKCYRYWQETGTDCGMCIAVCPWNKPQTWIHKIPQSFIAKSGLAGNMFVPMEKAFYGDFEPKPAPKWLEKQSEHYKEVNKKYNFKLK